MAGRLHLAHPPAASGHDEPGRHPIRVVLADDHAMVRRTLRLLLESDANVEVVAEADDLPTAIQQVSALRPHVLVLDLGMPDGSSIDAIRRLRETAPSTEIVVVTMQESPAFAQHTLAAGAIAFVLKDVADTDLAEAVRRAPRGEHYVSPQVEDKMTGLGDPRAAARQRAADGLSRRELDVVRLIARGYTSAEVAQALHLSKRTVETQRAQIQSKLGLRTRRELVGYALGQGLLAP